MSRPLKEGIDYFPLDVDIFEDDKLFDVTNEFGPVGEVIYLRLLCLIYKNGYYYKFDSLDKLASMLIKSIGNRWIRDKQSVKQVIPFLAKCNLFSSELMQENVLTSASIQRRYLKATERRQTMNNLKYWLLKEEVKEEKTDNLLLTDVKNSINVHNNSINVCNNSQNVNDNEQRKEEKSKVKKSKVKERKERFKSLFSHKDISLDFEEEKILSDISDKDFEVFIKCIKESDFLKDNNNLDLSWLLKNKEKVVKGEYKTFKRSNQDTYVRNANNRVYTEEELEEFVTDIKDVKW